MFQQYQPCCLRCHVHMAQHIVIWLMFPLWNAWKVSMSLRHLKPWGRSFLLVQPCWPKRLGFLSRFSPAQLTLSDVHFGSQHTEPRGELCMGERTGCTGWCRWTVQPLWHPKRTDAPSSGHLVWCVTTWVLKATVQPYCNRACLALLHVTESLQIAQSWWKWQIDLFILCGHRVNLIKPGGFQSAIKANWWNILSYTPPHFPVVLASPSKGQDFRAHKLMESSSISKERWENEWSVHIFP